MNDDMSQTFYFSDLEALVISHQISQPSHEKIKELLLSKDPKILNLFHTYDWSKNEKAFLSQIMSLVPPDQSFPPPNVVQKLDSIKKRPPSITVPFNRELSYYSTMDSPFSFYEMKEVELKPMNLLTKTQRSDRLCLNFQKQENCIEEKDDLNCSFNSSIGEENKNSISRKMQFLKNLNLQTMNFENDTDETSEESMTKISSEELLA